MPARSRRATVRVEHGADGRRLAVAREVSAAPEDAWSLLAETGNWPDWGPTVSAVRPADATVERGLSGEIQVAGRPWVPFEVTDVDVDVDADADGSGTVRRWTWRVARVPATGHRVEDAPTGCRVVFELPLWASPYVPVCRRALARIEGMLRDS